VKFNLCTAVKKRKGDFGYNGPRFAQLGRLEADLKSRISGFLK